MKLVLDTALESQRNKFQRDVAGIKIVTEMDYIEAGNLLLVAKNLRRAIVEKFAPLREQFVRAKQVADQGRKQVDDFVTEQCEPITALETVLSRKRLDWSEAERRRREQEAAAREAELRAQREADAIARAETMQANEAPPELIDRVLDEASRNVPSVRVEAPQKTEGLRTVMRWRFKIENVKSAALWLAENGYAVVKKHGDKGIEYIEIPVNPIVKAQKAACAIPGVRVWSQQGEELSGRT